MCEDAVHQLSRFLEPGEFVAQLERVRAGMSRERIYRDPKNQPLKDAWVGGMFALGYQEFRRALVEVRICAPERFPDFQVRTQGVTFDFEATMVLRAGRQMTAEYRQDAALGPARKEKPEDLPPFDERELADAIAKKAAKSYGGQPHLAIYLNTQGKSVELHNLAAEASTKNGEVFESIWFVTGHHIGCGKPSPLLLAPDDWFRIPVE